MNARRGLLLLLGPMAGLGLLLLAMAFRGRDRSPAPEPAASVKKRSQVALHPLPAREKAPSPPAPAEEIARSMDEATAHSTYQNYRTAVATGNDALQKALLPVLARHRAAHVARAQQELSSADTDEDREIAQKTLESLRR
jgi:hypothetical protein